MTARSKTVGEFGERVAAQRLEAAGYRILARNWRSPSRGRGFGGELDIVAEDPNGELAFIEVKTRSGPGYGHPAEAITPLKAARLRVLAGEWLAGHPHPGAVRIDVVAVRIPGSGPALVEHLQGVIR